jgi:hypothetical protein
LLSSKGKGPSTHFSGNNFGLSQNLGIPAASCACKIAKFDCVTGEVRTSGDNRHFRSGGGIDTRISPADVELEIGLMLALFLWTFKKTESK